MPYPNFADFWGDASPFGAALICPLHPIRTYCSGSSISAFIVTGYKVFQEIRNYKIR